MISKAPAEAVDAGPSEKAASSLLALTAQGRAPLQGAAGGSFLLLSVSSTSLPAVVPFSGGLAGQRFFYPGSAASFGERRQERRPWREGGGETLGSPWLLPISLLPLPAGRPAM